ncbi:MAG: Xaa-Pro peptidase family protein [Clostridia bacterium]|nr:Xaa-Pro peptidase family protein [Clostridia bacterium]
MDICRQLYDMAGVDTLVILTPSNTRYLSGYSSTNCQIILTKRNSYFLTDMRYYLEAKELLGNKFEVLCQDIKESKELVEGSKIGIESDISYGQYKTISQLTAGNLIEITPSIESLRSIKSNFEIDCIKRAQSITVLAYGEALKILKEGVSEVEIVAYIEYIMKKNACQIAFDSIVAFGEHTASPHAHPSQRKLSGGDFVTMDIGASFDGYCSDMTRTVGYGQLSTKQVEIYNHVLKAQSLAIENLKAGMTGKEGDAIARNYFKENFLDKYFTHSLGHGVGIDIHESVGLTPREERVLQPNMVVTVEPGLYIDGEFGVRIEDMVQITESGVIDLTNADKQLIIL